jgi:hypothetical protein
VCNVSWKLAIDVRSVAYHRTDFTNRQNPRASINRCDVGWHAPGDSKLSVPTTQMLIAADV